MAGKLLTQEYSTNPNHEIHIPLRDIPLGKRGIPNRRVLGSSKSRLFGPILRASYGHVRLYGFLREFHTFLCRICVVLESKWGVLHPSAGPLFHQSKDQGLQACRATLQRMRDMRKIVEDEEFPWEITPLDLCVFLLGWEEGEKWAKDAYNADKRNKLVE